MGLGLSEASHLSFCGLQHGGSVWRAGPGEGNRLREESKTLIDDAAVQTHK
jgi:hypothetical protein